MHTGSVALDSLKILPEFASMICDAVYVDRKSFILPSNLFPVLGCKKGRLARGLTKKKTNAAARKMTQAKPLLGNLAAYNEQVKKVNEEQKQQEANQSAQADNVPSSQLIDTAMQQPDQ